MPGIKEKRFYKAYTRYKPVPGASISEASHTVIADDFGAAEKKVREWFAESNTRGVIEYVRAIEDVTTAYGAFLT